LISCRVKDEKSGEIFTVRGDYFFSTMPVTDLIKALGENVPVRIKKIAEGLMYRDFITVGLLLKKLKIKNDTGVKSINGIIPDNWIYVQEKDVKLGRIQIFNNWSPYMVKDENTVWLGLEYFLSEGDELWVKPDKDFVKFAVEELFSIGFIKKEDVLDSVLIRLLKAYPAYCREYENLNEIKKYLERYENLFLMGRNGMHRYNNTDHSMLTAMTAVDNIINGVVSKDNIWSLNVGEEYHEENDA